MKDTVFILFELHTQGDYNDNRTIKAEHMKGYTHIESKAEEWASSPPDNFTLRTYKTTKLLNT
jgi:hypothetical protein